MRDDQLAAAREAAVDGIDFDGFRLERDGDEFVLGTPERPDRRLDGDLRAALKDHADHLTNWYVWHAIAPQKADRWAFLRWIERAAELDVERRYAAMTDGKLARTWGQLRPTVTLAGDGERRYAVRHEDDVDTPADELDDYDDPLDARTLARYDDDERYRPLKTAPTLRTGWHFPDLSGDELVRVVEFFYPATIPNWYREREPERSDGSVERAGEAGLDLGEDPGNASGEAASEERRASREGGLDVTHWRETAERQTGIYDMIEGLDDEGVAWMAEACCVDSQCLKRREWDLDEETELDVPRGDGEFPCREPCSLVIAASRKFTTMQSERTRTYEFELTIGEKNQIEEIIDAVADGTVDDVREADVYEGANRYRARFLRAKLFDEDGNLAGGEVDE